MDRNKLQEMLEIFTMNIRLSEGIDAFLEFEDGFRFDSDIKQFVIRKNKKMNNGISVSAILFVIKLFDDHVILATIDDERISYRDRVKTSSIEDLELEMLRIRECTLNTVI